MSKKIEIIHTNLLGYSISYFTKIIYTFCAILFLWFYLVPLLNSKITYSQSKIENLSRQSLYLKNKITTIHDINIFDLLQKYDSFRMSKTRYASHVRREKMIHELRSLKFTHDFVEDIKVSYASITASEKKSQGNRLFLYDVYLSFKVKDFSSAISIIKEIDKIIPKYSNIYYTSIHQCGFSYDDLRSDHDCVKVALSLVFRHMSLNFD